MKHLNAYWYKVFILAQQQVKGSALIIKHMAQERDKLTVNFLLIEKLQACWT